MDGSFFSLSSFSVSFFSMSLYWMMGYIITGIVSGFLAGLFGIGGGMIIVPALIFYFQAVGFAENSTTQLAIGTSLATIIFTAMSSIRAHHNAGRVDYVWLKRSAPAMVIGALISGFIAEKMSGIFLQILIGVLAFVIGFQLLLNWTPRPQNHPIHPARHFIIASCIGFASGLFGIGGGSFSVPYLVFNRVAMQTAVGTSAACGLPLAIAGTIGFIIGGWNVFGLPNATTGFVYWPAVLGIAIASVPAAQLGAFVAHRTSAKNLKRWFSFVLFVVGWQLLEPSISALF
ncbi:MAG: sulfite exporter TauE/SafE family protein [Pseudomonadota bacterium]